VEEIDASKAMLVTDTGFFAELPDHGTQSEFRRVEQEELAAALEAALDDPSLRAAMGAQAAEFAEQHFRARALCRDLIRFAREVLSIKPLFQLSERLSGELNCMGVKAQMDNRGAGLAGVF